MVNTNAISQNLEWHYDLKVKDHPEATSAEYDIVVNSKPYFLYNATQTSRFRTNAIFFTWIDAGYGKYKSDILLLFTST